MSACSASRCELTETYSPAAIDRAPAMSPAIPAVTTALVDSPAAAAPSTRLGGETMPALAPRTAARRHPERWLGGISARRGGPAPGGGGGRTPSVTGRRPAP